MIQNENQHQHQLKKLSTSLLLNTELTIVGYRLVDTVAAALPEETTVSKMLDLIRADIAQVEAALGREQASEFTAQLSEKDQIRDDAFVALRDLAKACTNRSNPEVSQAGELIYALFEARGLTLYSKGYTEQSAGMNLLLEDLSTEQASDALATMGAPSWYDELRLAQDSFEQAVREKLSTESQDDILPIRFSRSQLTDHIETLLGCVRAMRDYQELTDAPNGYSALDESISSINEIITNAMTIAKSRRTRNESANEHEDLLESTNA